MRDKETLTHLKKCYDNLSSQGFNVFGVFLYGSQNYGLDTSASDVDCIAFVVPSFSDLYDGHFESSEHETRRGMVKVVDIRLLKKHLDKGSYVEAEALLSDYRYVPQEFVVTFRRLSELVCGEWYASKANALKKNFFFSAYNAMKNQPQSDKAFAKSRRNAARLLFMYDNVGKLPLRELVRLPDGERAELKALMALSREDMEETVNKSAQDHNLYDKARTAELLSASAGDVPSAHLNEVLKSTVFFYGRRALP